MRLKTFKVQNYRCIDDSGVVDVQPDVTCLVGKNESGKTALLQALYRINPAHPATFDEVRDYPRRRLRKYQRRKPQDPDEVVRATFVLDDGDKAVVASEFGDGVLAGDEVTVVMDYDNEQYVELDVDERALVRALVAKSELTEEVKDKATAASTVEDLHEILDSAGESGPGVQSLLERVNQHLEEDLDQIVWLRCLKDRCPTFLFFDEYSYMAGSAKLNILANDQATQADPKLRTLRDLLELAGTSPQELQSDANYEHHKALLESTALEITDEVFRYWSQNKDIEVEFDVHRPTGTNDPGTLYVRIKNRRHGVTVPFDERSRGFVWFFSFLAAFRAVAEKHDRLILLLDEPGLNLHGTAQGDLLRFIEERLAFEHQVIYTTHSPFMIQAAKLNRVRTVEDVDNEGTRVSADCLNRDPATVFPLQGALGYELAQTLFLGPNCLLVEGPSDLLYLQVMSANCEVTGRSSLDPGWVVVPVGGADKVATFVALLGANQLNVVVLLDFAKKDRQRIGNLVKRRLLEQRRIISAAEFVAGDEADIEDLFELQTYLELVAAAYRDAGSLRPEDLPPGSRVVKRVEKALKERGVRFDHFAPAREATRLLTTDVVKDSELDRFARLFEKVNGLLSG